MGYQETSIYDEKMYLNESSDHSMHIYQRRLLKECEEQSSSESVCIWKLNWLNQTKYETYPLKYKQ